MKSAVRAPEREPRPQQPSAGRLRGERRENPADTAPAGNSFARLTSDSVEILSETGF